MTGPDITVLRKKQYLIDQSEFLLEQKCCGNCNSCTPESEQDKCFSAIPISVWICAANKYSPKLNKQISKKDITLGCSH